MVCHLYRAKPLTEISWCPNLLTDWRKCKSAIYWYGHYHCLEVDHVWREIYVFFLMMSWLKETCFPHYSPFMRGIPQQTFMLTDNLRSWLAPVQGQVIKWNVMMPRFTDWLKKMQVCQLLIWTFVLFGSGSRVKGDLCFLSDGVMT